MGQACTKDCREEFRLNKWRLHHQTPDDFTKYMWQRDEGVPVLWIAYRATLVGVLVIAFISALFWPQEGSVWYKNFIYYSYWTSMTEIVTFVLALYITVKKFRTLKEYPNFLPLEEMPLSYKITWFFYNISAPCSYVVSILYWTFMYKTEKNISLGFSLVQYVFNVMCMTLDFCLNCFPYRLLHFYVPLIYSVIYGLFSIIYQSNGGTGNHGDIPIYKIMDWRKPNEALLTWTIQTVCVFSVHFTLWALYKLKCKIKKFIEDRLKKKARRSRKQSEKK